MTSNKEATIFGAVDIIITLLGVIIGLSFAASCDIVLTAILSVGIADSFANASGIYATTHVSGQPTIRPALYCFLSTIATMTIITIPFLVYPSATAIYISVTISLISLAFLGYYATPEDGSPYHSPIRILLTGFTVSIITFIIGNVLL